MRAAERAGTVRANECSVAVVKGNVCVGVVAECRVNCMGYQPRQSAVATVVSPVNNVVWEKGGVVWAV